MQTITAERSAAAAWCLVIALVVVSSGCGLADPQATLEREVESIQAKLPMEVEPGLVLTAVRAGEMRVEYQYRYDNELPPGFSYEAFQVEMEKNLLADACSNQEMKQFWENGISASYDYQTPDGLHMAKILITPRACGY